jgi:hypothetical protein
MYGGGSVVRLNNITMIENTAPGGLWSLLPLRFLFFFSASDLSIRFLGIFYAVSTYSVTCTNCLLIDNSASASGVIAANLSPLVTFINVHARFFPSTLFCSFFSFLNFCFFVFSEFVYSQHGHQRRPCQRSRRRLSDIYQLPVQ